MKTPFRPELLTLYAITADGAAADPASRGLVRIWMQAGVRAVQLRDKTLPAADLLDFGRYLRAITAEYGALFIVNDDAGLAKLLDADGVHLGRTDGSAEVCHHLLGPGSVVGRSAHTPEQIAEAVEEGVDYIGMGPVWPTGSKKLERAPLGPAYVGRAAAESPLPVVAIGGITPENVAELAAAGCGNAAVISALADARTAANAAGIFLRALSGVESAGLPGGDTGLREDG